MLVDCPMELVRSGMGPRPHQWMLLERNDFKPPNAPAAVRALFVFFCQWCLTTTTRSYEELPILERQRSTNVQR